MGELTVSEDTEIEIIARDAGWSGVPGYPDRPAKWVFEINGEAHYVNEAEAVIL